MTYSEQLDQAIERLHDEGRYRTFIDIERRNGNFPHAVWTKPDGSEKDITVWCGNDYLGMGQNEVVRQAMHDAIEATGAGSGGTRNISAKKRLCCSPLLILPMMRRSARCQSCFRG